MTDHPLPERMQVQTDIYQRRINYTAKVLRITLRLAGLVLLVVQIVKAFIAAFDGSSFDLSIVMASLFAVLVMGMTVPPLLEKAIARFARSTQQQTFKLVAYTFPLVFTAVLIIIKLQVGPTSDEWRYMSSEGSISEYGTALIYLLMPLFAYPVAKQFWRQQNRLMGWLYVLIAALALFIGMEEISWGQKILGYQEPRFWSEHNVQSEFTFHNLSFYQHYLLHQSFLAVGFIGSICWLGLRYWRNHRESFRFLPKGLDLSYLIPNWQISSFFYPTFLFYLLYDYTNFKERVNFLHSADQEHCELVMAMGVFLFVLINFFRQAKTAEQPIATQVDSLETT